MLVTSSDRRFRRETSILLVSICACALSSVALSVPVPPPGPATCATGVAVDPVYGTGVQYFSDATNGWCAGPSLPAGEGRSEAGAAMVVGVAGSQVVYVAGGRDAAGALRPDVMALALPAAGSACPGTGTWTVATTLATPRRMVGVAEFGGRVVVAGGWDAGGNPSAQVDAYDPATNTWTALPPLPTARAGVLLLSDPGTGLWAIGGATGTAGSPIATNEVNIYDPVTNSWVGGAAGGVMPAAYGSATPVPQLVNARMNATGTVVGTTGVGFVALTVYGGANGAGEVADIEFVSSGDLTTWGVTGTMGTPRRGLVSGLVNSLGVTHTMLAGGATVAARPLGTVEDEGFGSGPLPVPVDFAAGVATNGGMVVVGGEQCAPPVTPVPPPGPATCATGVAVDPVYGTGVQYFSDATNGWCAGPSLPAGEGRSEAGAAMVVGVAGSQVVYVAGGRDAAGALRPDVMALALPAAGSACPGTGTWTVATTLATPRRMVGVAEFGGRVVVAGGWDAGGNPSAQVDAYDPATNTWTALPPLPTARAGVLLLSDPGTGLWAIGGATGTAGSPIATNEVNIYDPVTNSWVGGAAGGVMPAAYGSATPVPQLVNARMNATGTVVGTTGVGFVALTVYGGANGAGEVADIEFVSSGDLTTWGVTGTMGTPRRGLVSGLVNSLGVTHTMLAGGATVAARPLGTVEDEGFGSGPLPVPVDFAAGVATNGGMVVVGGEQCAPPVTPSGCLTLNPGGDWPMWGHDAQHTFAQSCPTGLTPPLELMWTATITRAHSPIVVGARSYWLEVPPGPPQPQVPGVFSPRFDLVARDNATGTIIWRKSGPVFPGFMAAGEGQIVVSLATPNGVGGGIRGYDLATGAQIRFYNPITGNPTAGNPGLLSIDSSTLFVTGFYGGGTVAYSLTTGAILWQSGFGSSSSPPVVGGGLVYVLNTVFGTVQPVKIRALNALTGALVWTKPIPGNVVRLAYDNGRLFYAPVKLGISGPGSIGSVAVDAMTGTWTWSKTGLNIDALANSRVYGTRMFFGQLAPTGGINSYLANCVEKAGSVGFSGDQTVPSQFDQATGGLLGSISSRRYFGQSGGVGSEGNGFMYRFGTDVSSPRFVTTEDLASGDTIWTPDERGGASLGGIGAPGGIAIANDQLFVHGGFVYGPRSVDPPSNLQVSLGYNRVDLTWNPPAASKSPVARYEVYRMSEEHAWGEGPQYAAQHVQGLEGQLWHNKLGNPRIKFAGSSLTNSYSDMGITTGAGYYYAVRAITTAGKDSWFTKEALAIPFGLHAALRHSGNLQFYGLAYADAPGTLLSWNIDFSYDGIVFSPTGLSGTTARGLASNCGFGFFSQKILTKQGAIVFRLRVKDTAGFSRDAYELILLFNNNKARTQYFNSQIPSWWWRTFAYSEHLHPEGIARDRAGFVYVVDTGMHRVVRLDALAHPLSVIGEPHSGKTLPGDLVAPVALAEAEDGRLFVADRMRNEIVIFDEDGSYLTSFGGPGKAVGKLRQPGGLAFDADGHLWVSDTGNNRVQEFEADGIFLRMIATEGTAPGMVRSPAQICVDDAGVLWIADSGNDRIQAFAADGTTRFVLTGEDAPGGGLKQPTGVAVSLASTPPAIYVSDPTRNRIEQFNLDGTFLEEIGEQGTADGEFRHPSALALDQGGTHLYAADTDNNHGRRVIAVPADPVDETAPRAELLGPVVTASVFIGETLTFTGRAADAYFKSYRLEISGPDGVTVLVESAVPVWNGPLGSWKTAGFTAGFYSVRLVVEDQIGGVSESVMALFLDGSAAAPSLAAGAGALIRSATVAPPAIPGGLFVGRLDYDLRRNASVAWAVADVRSNRLVTPVFKSGEARAGGQAGPNAVWWDGRDGEGVRQPAGRYMVILVAETAGVVDRRRIPLTIPGPEEDDHEGGLGGRTFAGAAGGASSGSGSGAGGLASSPGAGSPDGGSGGSAGGSGDHTNHGVRDHGQGEGRDGAGQGNGQGSTHGKK